MGKHMKTNITKSPSEKPEHLVVLVHGLFGHDSHLNTFASVMSARFEKENKKVLIYLSNVNQRIKSTHGIDECGDRFVEEIKQVVTRNPTLKTVSILGHSLGGLIARYGIGHVFDSKEHTVFGLKPLHFVTVCTPHLGCNDTYKNLKQQDSVTPCLRWLGLMPCLGRVAAFFTTLLEPFFTCMILRKTGRQLFLRDSENPLIMQMASAEHRAATPAESGSEELKAPEVQVDYLGALASFAERTCYGNIRYDHVVAWENATIRRKCDLPTLAKEDLPYGVVNEEISDPAHCASKNLTRQSTCKKGEAMIRNLEALGWRRVDVKIKVILRKGAPFTHDNIISKKDIHDNFQTVAKHASNLIVQTINNYD